MQVFCFSRLVSRLSFVAGRDKPVAVGVSRIHGAPGAEVVLAIHVESHLIMDAFVCSKFQILVFHCIHDAINVEPLIQDRFNTVFQLSSMNLFQILKFQFRVPSSVVCPNPRQYQFKLLEATPNANPNSTAFQ